MQVLYQAELHPDIGSILESLSINYKYFFGKRCVLFEFCRTAIIKKSGHITTINKKEKKCQNKKTNNANAKTVPKCTTTKKKDVAAKNHIATNKKSPVWGIFILVFDNRIFTKAFICITARCCSFADEIALFVQACRTYVWRFGANVPHTTICTTPHNNLILFEQ